MARDAGVRLHFQFVALRHHGHGPGCPPAQSCCQFTRSLSQYNGKRNKIVLILPRSSGNDNTSREQLRES